MARPQGRSSFPSMNPMAQDFTITSAPARPSSTLQDPTLRSNTRSLNTQFISSHLPSQTVPGLKPRQQLPDQLLTDDLGPLPDDYPQHTRQRTSGSAPEDPLQLLNLTNVRHQPKVPSHKPWNHIDASMSLHADHNLLKIEHINPQLPTDSGYTGSLKSRHPLQPAQSTPSPLGSLELGSAVPYDEPVGSTVQQTHYLPDQQHRFPTLNPINTSSPRAPSLTGGESIATPSGSPPFRCEECGDMFNTKSEKTKHMARHTKKFTCEYPQCPRGTDGFATKNDLDRHKSSVHHDNTVGRKEYRCCVPGCKDPNKIWDRKDNFKAHVKRMHPDQNVDEVVMNSFIGLREASATGALSHHESIADPSPHFADQQQRYLPEDQLGFVGGGVVGSDFNHSMMDNHQSLNDSHLFAQNQIAYPRPPPSIGDLSQGVTGDDESYYLPGSSEPPHTNLQPFGTYSSSVYGHGVAHPRSATTRPTNYDSSMTIAPPTSIPDPSHAISRHPDLHISNNQAISGQAMPGPDRRSDESRSQLYPWSSRGESSSTIDPSGPVIDHIAQTGSWDEATAPTHHVSLLDTPEQTTQTGLVLNTDEHPATSSLTGQHLSDVMHRIDAILDTLSPEDKSIVLKTVRNQSGVSNENRRVVQRVVEAFSSTSKPDERKFVCSREGCGKTFKQNNIKTKHERRHFRLFFCTFDDCYSTFGTKDDLRRHERRKHIKDAFEGYRCFKEDVQSSHHKPPCFKFFRSKDEFEQHRRDVHRERAEKNHGGLKAYKSCFIRQGSPGHFWCGFCDRVIQNKVDVADASRTEKVRLDHIDQHISKECRTMEHWIDLKSGGKTKSQVKFGTAHQNVQDDSQDEEDSEAFSPEALDMVRYPNAPALANSYTHTAAPVPANMKRKRSYQDEDPNMSMPSMKVPRIQVHASESQDDYTIPNISEGTSTGSILFDNATSRPAPQAHTLECCFCHAPRHVSNQQLCCAQCFHQRCPQCSFWDVLGRPIHVQVNTSNRQQSIG